MRAKILRGNGGGNAGRASDVRGARAEEETIEIVGIVPANATRAFCKRGVRAARSICRSLADFKATFLFRSISFACPRKRSHHGGLAAAHRAAKSIPRFRSLHCKHSPSISIRTWISGWFAPAPDCSRSLERSRLVWPWLVSTESKRIRSRDGLARSGSGWRWGLQPGTVLRMIMGEGVIMLSTGSRSVYFSRGDGKILSGILYEVGPFDPVAFTVAPLVLAVAALVATWLPARRATKVDPIRALRTE